MLCRYCSSNLYRLETKPDLLLVTILATDDYFNKNKASELKFLVLLVWLLSSNNCENWPRKEHKHIVRIFRDVMEHALERTTESTKNAI